MSYAVLPVVYSCDSIRSLSIAAGPKQTGTRKSDHFKSPLIYISQRQKLSCLVRKMARCIGERHLPIMHDRVKVAYTVFDHVTLTHLIIVVSE